MCKSIFFILTVFCFLIGSPAVAQRFELVENTQFSKAKNPSRSSAFIDTNNDGWLDIFITNGPKYGYKNQLFINNQAGGFTEIVDAQICKKASPSDGVTFGDINNDGFLDAYIANWYGQKNEFFLGKDSGKFQEVEKGAIIQSGFSETASWGDYDQDGFLDLFIANSNRGSNVLLKNQKGGNFEEIDNKLTNSRLNTRNVNWIDFDQDGDVDIFLTNEFGEKNQLFVQKDNVFEQVETSVVTMDTENSVSSNWVDYDNDGDFDLYVTNIEGQNNILYDNNAGIFERNEAVVISQDKNSGFSSTWGDIDNDGDLDLYVTNAYTGIKTTNNLYYNNGDGSFTQNLNDVSATERGWSYAAAMGDYDNDGYLDLITTRTYGQGESNQLFHNVGGENKWIIVSLTGTVSNRSAIGAIVKLSVIIDGKKVNMMREVSAQHGYNCVNSLRVHFGLGDGSIVDKLSVIWPSGQVDIMSKLAINQFLNLKESAEKDR